PRPRPKARALAARLAAEQPAHLANGVHLIVVQSADGSLVVGDSHHYAATPDPFGHEAVDRLILEEFATGFGRPPPPVAERWTGTYAYAADRDVLIDTPAPGVRLAMVTTGAGASTGFALGEEGGGPLVWANFFWERRDERARRFRHGDLRLGRHHGRLRLLRAGRRHGAGLRRPRR